MKNKIRSTTVIAVKRNGHVAMAGDGQVTAGNTVMKGNAHKVRRIYDGKILTGFAGSVADSFTLCDLFETKIKEFNGDLTRAAVELAKMWRTEKSLQLIKIKFFLLVAMEMLLNRKMTFLQLVQVEITLILLHWLILKAQTILPAKLLKNL